MNKRDALFDACDPFARAANILDAHPQKPYNDDPLRELLPGVWPTMGDLRKLRDAMVAMGWTNGHERKR